MDVSNPDLSEPFETRYTYDLLDRTVRIEYPEDPRYDTSISVNYSYNSMGVNGIVAEYGTEPLEKTLVSSIDYNEFGQMKSITNGNGVTTSYEYDIKGRLSHLASSAFKNNETMYLQDVDYTFNINNSIRSVEDNPTYTVQGTTLRHSRYDYSYDGLNRLITADGTYEDDLATQGERFRRAYSYAPSGNLTRKEIRDPDTDTLVDGWDYTYSNHAATGIDT
ncbi:MAG: RHS repeat protein, partial [Halobacteriota archaeon]|nr:RHS repeat protein [Halobacteriota archaeon]